MDVRQLRYFLAVAAERNFSRAAERLHMAQPPLSRQIQQLEQEVGAALFDRDSRPLALTDAGRLFYEHAVQVTRRLDAMKDAMRTFVSSIGRASWSASCLRCFMRACPTSFAAFARRCPTSISALSK